MTLTDAFLLESTGTNVWIASRSDQIRGDGSAGNPYNGGVSFGPAIPVNLPTSPGIEIVANTGDRAHGFFEGDMIQISGVTGSALTVAQWNRTFAIYDVTPTTFRFAMGFVPNAPGGFPKVARVNFVFDQVLRALPPYTRVNLGPSPRDSLGKPIPFQTRGFAPHGVGGWQPKSGQKIVGAGTDVTVLQLVGAGVLKVGEELVEQHYHAIGMPIVPTAQTAITPLEHFEISNLTVDCNLDGQPLRGQNTYTPVACGALRILGNHCRVRDVKAINWGTKSLKQGCFVISIIGASGAPTDANSQPVITEKVGNGIEECIVIQPSQNCARETTVLHLGGVKNPDNHAQGFARACFIRKNFVDCSFTSPADPAIKFSGFFLTAAPGTSIDYSSPPSVIGVFLSKRAHYRANGELVRFHNPRNPGSLWNGYFRVNPPDNYSLNVDLTNSEGTNDDSSLVVMGTEFRAIAVSSCLAAVVEQNQIHNCWIGGPYQSPLDDSVTEPTVPPTLAREERLDPLNALNTLSLIVRNNTYKDVTVGPYWSMGGLTAPVANNSISYDANSGVVSVETPAAHTLWVGARVLIEQAPDARYHGLHEIASIPDASAFTYQLAPGLGNMGAGGAQYRVVSGTDFLLVEGNVIEIADLDETEFAVKAYPLSGSPALQQYRACGILVGDNGLSPQGGPYAHGQVILRHNKIYYLDDQTFSNVPEALGPPAGCGMQISGAQHVQVSYNVLRLNPRNPLQLFRCGPAQFFNNKQPNGVLLPGWQWDTNGHYDEPETLAEDAMILAMFKR